MMKINFRLLLLIAALMAKPALTLCADDTLTLCTDDELLMDKDRSQPSPTHQTQIEVLEINIRSLSSTIQQKQFWINHFRGKIIDSAKHTQKQCPGDAEYIVFCHTRIRELTAELDQLQRDLAQMRTELKDWKRQEKLQQLLVEADAELKPIMMQYSESFQRLKNDPEKRRSALGFLDATKDLIMGRYNQEKDRIMQEYYQTP